MRKRILWWGLMVLPLGVWAQFSDDFSDGNFTENPQWMGDTDRFVVENEQLRLMDDAAGASCLATRSSMVAGTQWEFWVRLAFVPSDNNHPRIYLVSDARDLHGALNGYFLQIGKTGGDNKRLYFYRQDGAATTELMEGSLNLAAATNNIIRVRVTRDAAGQWSFWADPHGGHLFIPQGEAFDNTHTQSSWFGVYCRYTISNSNRFYFDDFYVGEIIPEDDAPEVTYLHVQSPNTLDVHFSKVVALPDAENITNYSADGGLGHPLIASRQPRTPNVVRLMFAENFTENQRYRIQIQGIEDYFGNTMAAFSGEFVRYIPTRFDVVFNEIMANNSPVVGLPPYDWFELYNTTDFPVNLEGWTFQHGATRRELPFAEVPALGYIVFTTSTALPHLEGFGNVVAIPGLSAVALTQGGTTLQLFDDRDRLISFVNYSDRWYRDAAKSNGGWSLEKIDPYNFCQGMENWRASESPAGGTPGTTNSIRADNPDTTSPDLLRVAYLAPDRIKAVFSEPMDEASLLDPGLYSLEGIGVTAVHPRPPDFSRVELVLDSPLQEGVIYNLNVDQSLTDCAGNPLGRRSGRLAIPSQARPFDVVINEVLFNPPDRGARYMEIYNRSDQVFDLKNMLITSRDTIEQSLTSIQEISQEGFLFFPGDYAVLTNQPEAVLNTFMTPNPASFIRLSGMPRMTNANGILVLANKSLEIIDQFVYKEDMHFALLTSYKGVALERLNYHWPTQDRSNWHSAAQRVGFGTPGYKNSQFTAAPEPAEEAISVYPPVFSPDGDGQDDLLNISYVFPEPGYAANVRIYDRRGRLVRDLVQGELLATEGVITWDGTTGDRQKAPMGIYMVFLEVFDLQGNVQHHRKTAVLGGRL